ncbi:anti-sigma regulatory factor [Nocardioides sp. CER19]|uniref:anti-sigma regulatory factor n=1 Tax=Nocardioides sp. CER19 TaxID=3038538 RepID=UPI00244846D8|nr:anti-sigma regulatory factor [Nocardioides sp. CER19]MDH2414726.1 anti-sigma regulatory factor [Nocardioides sp. CER19]
MTSPTSESEATLTLAIVNDGDVVRGRQAVRDLAVSAKLSLVDQTKLVTATSELARNTLVYGGGGELRASIVSEGGRQGVEVEFIDDGPGIPDLDLALTDGWTSGSGLGLGLSGAKRLVEDFEVDSAPGRGTRVRIVKWKR